MLIAGIAPGAGALRDELASEFHVDVASTFDQAMSLMKTASPSVLIVGYHFDQFRPYRLIQYVTAEYPQTPIILVRAMPLVMPHEDDGAIRDAYLAMGISEYLVLDTEDRSSLSTRLRAAIAAVLGARGRPSLPEGRSARP